MTVKQRGKKHIRRIVKTASVMLISLLIGWNLYSMNASRLLGNAVPMPFGVGAAVVLSGSMEPALSAGDLLIIAKQTHYEIGDIVVYQDGRVAVTHRIVAFAEDEVITRGDANNTADRPIALTQIKGEVVLAIPLLGYAVNLMKTPSGTLLIFLLALFLLERSFHAEKRADGDQLDEIKAEIERLKQHQNDR